MPAASHKNTNLKKEIEESAKMFDVAKPGNTPATATSRPLIVKRSAGTKRDPMVTAEAAEEDQLPTHTAPQVSPPVQAPSEIEGANSSPKVVEPIKIEDKNETEVLPESSKDKVEEPISEEPPKPEGPSNSAAVEAVVSEVSAKRQTQKDDEILAAKLAEVEKSIQSKEFFVPIGEASRRRSNNRTMLFLVVCIVLGLGGLNFAIDAGALDIGIPALTNLL